MKTIRVTGRQKGGVDGTQRASVTSYVLTDNQVKNGNTVGVNKVHLMEYNAH